MNSKIVDYLITLNFKYSSFLMYGVCEMNCDRNASGDFNRFFDLVLFLLINNVIINLAKGLKIMINFKRFWLFCV